MTAAVVGVHGIGNLQARTTPDAAAAALSARWTAGLRRGLGADATIQVQVACYAHRLARQNAQAGVELESLDDGAYRLLLAWAGELGAPEEVAQGRLTAPARAAADWIAHRFGAERSLVRRFVARFCPESLPISTNPTVARPPVATSRTRSPPVARGASSLTPWARWWPTKRSGPTQI